MPRTSMTTSEARAARAHRDSEDPAAMTLAATTTRITRLVRAVLEENPGATDAEVEAEVRRRQSAQLAAARAKSPFPRPRREEVA